MQTWLTGCFINMLALAQGVCCNLTPPENAWRSGGGKSCPTPKGRWREGQGTISTQGQELAVWLKIQELGKNKFEDLKDKEPCERTSSQETFEEVARSLCMDIGLLPAPLRCHPSARSVMLIYRAAMDTSGAIGARSRIM